ncbi:MAG: hypothetical protein K0R51_216 [Cytophagaceae bacterium]|jgi:hypothetical protein|nr:hypothetical protein [Cytophagaceae bacterium]
MRAIPSFFFTAFVAVFLNSCSTKDHREASMESAAADSTALSNGFISSSAAEETKDTSRKFIRTAEMKFKVKNVFDATYKIEDLTKSFGGFVTYTNLSSSINHVSHVAISADSSLETTYYEVRNTMTIRVPNTKLDSTLRAVAVYIEYLDYRTISADDVALQLLSNKLTQKRIRRHEKRLEDAIDNRGKKLNETTNAEENLYYKQEQGDAATISNLALNDQINFSTVKLDFYQRETVKRELIANDKNIEAYQPSFGFKIWEALKEGWTWLSGFFVFTARLWGFIVLGILVYVLIKRFGHLLKGKG